MGNLIGVLSTVILVSTVCTLIFAVGAYVISRKGRNGVGTMNEENSQAAEQNDFSSASTVQPSPSTLFKRVQPGSGAAAVTQEADVSLDEEYQWK